MISTSDSSAPISARSLGTRPRQQRIAHQTIVESSRSMSTEDLAQCAVRREGAYGAFTSIILECSHRTVPPQVKRPLRCCGPLQGVRVRYRSQLGFRSSATKAREEHLQESEQQAAQKSWREDAFQ